MKILEFLDLFMVKYFFFTYYTKNTGSAPVLRFGAWASCVSSPLGKAGQMGQINYLYIST